MLKLLLVDDAERVRNFLIEGLRAEHHYVDTACDGAEGLTLALSRNYDVIILDQVMPGMTGSEMCSALRGSGSRIPVLMLTALDEVDQKVECLRGGADDYVVKPFDLDELLARIEALARRSQGADHRERHYRFGDVIIDREAHVATVREREVDLTLKEFQIMELFAQSDGRILSRSRILNKIWGYDSDPMTNVVDVFISRLRVKFGWDTESGPIRTVRGVGYRLSLH